MAEGQDRVQARVDNISTVKPILEALRTISLGSWQSALKKRQSVNAFAGNYLEILEMVAPFVKSSIKPRSKKDRKPKTKNDPNRILVMVGSERGLCGSYNQQLLTALKKEIPDPSTNTPSLWILGTRLVRIVKRAGYPVAWWQSLSSTSLPAYAALHELSRQWLSAYEVYQLDEVFLLSHHYQNASHSEVKKERLLPYSFDDNESPSQDVSESWPPPILETDPLKIYLKVVEQMGTMRFYSLLLEATAVEHSTRYQLMEEASQNAGRMIDEMTEILQMYRRESITREMQELASGAGLLGGT